MTTTDPARNVDISIPDLMDVIDQFANARSQYVKTGQGAGRAWDLREHIESMLTQEKEARHSLERELEARQASA